MRFSKLILLCLALTLSLPVLAGKTTPATPEQKLKAALAKRFPAMKPTSIRKTPIGDLYEVMFGSRLFYFSADGRYMIEGVVYDWKHQKNLTAPRLAAARIMTLDKLGEQNMLVFKADKQKHVITVFTDPDCPYCRVMHNQVKGYNSRGITVRYLLYPRAGVNSMTYKKSVAVWCAKDRHAAFTEVNKGMAITFTTCKNPVQQHMLLGKEMRLSGTPMIILPDGRVVPGYVPPEQLRLMLESKKK